MNAADDTPPVDLVTMRTTIHRALAPAAHAVGLAYALDSLCDRYEDLRSSGPA